jgi:hypothetical protein
MTELIDVRADAVGPGERICLSGALVLITGVDTHERVVDLHTEYGPALRLLRTESVALVVAETTWAADAA